jgi:hypothetical protein
MSKKSPDIDDSVSERISEKDIQLLENNGIKVEVELPR